MAEPSPFFLDDEDSEDDPLLPSFSNSLLEQVPVFQLVHTVRDEIISRVDTTLTWDQLRSPQINQFLVRPALAKCREKKSMAILYALLANQVQFSRESNETPANAGVAQTRGLLCELLALKSLKEFTSRELISALTYEFRPLAGSGMLNVDGHRISTLEVAISACSKHFLSHPVVVSVMSAIWEGKISFHSSQDDLHRERVHRREATIYDPRNASIGKLSRLRVPRYRSLANTFALAVLLALYMCILIDRSPTLTGLEIVFWFWSLGFMLDEVVGAFDTGYSLYITSLWNLFDFGILFLLIIYYALRLYTIITGSSEVLNVSFDILASVAILLFPRIFSVLDHYPYFSQMLISLRRMSIDVVVSMLFIIIFFSGFWVAFTLSFARDVYDARTIAYQLLQIFLGFTVPAWNSWDNYNLFGKTLLVGFIFLAHFIIVTIFVTILGNSFAEVSKNAREEHLFLFAVNTVTMVKSDSLFAYIAPFNLIEWSIHPLIYILPFRTFVRLNRTIIKVSHFFFLLLIFTYEHFFLEQGPFAMYEAQKRKQISSTQRGPSNFIKRRDSTGSKRTEGVLEQVFAAGGNKYPSLVRGSKGVREWVRNQPSLMSPPLGSGEMDLMNEHRRIIRPSVASLLTRDSLALSEGALDELDGHHTVDEGDDEQEDSETPRPTLHEDSPFTRSRRSQEHLKGDTPSPMLNSRRPGMPHRHTVQALPQRIPMRRSSLIQDTTSEERLDIASSFATQMAAAANVHRAEKREDDFGMLLFARLSNIESVVKERLDDLARDLKHLKVDAKKREVSEDRQSSQTRNMD